MLGNRPLAELTARDLRALVEDQVSESKSLEYKRALPGNSEADKREFLADVSSLANASGGHLILGALPRFLSIQQSLGVEPPLFVMLTLTGVRGYTMAVNPSRKQWRTYPIDRESLVTAEAIMDAYDSDPAELMRPAFDAIWNAAGWPRSMNYDEDGRWIGRG